MSALNLLATFGLTRKAGDGPPPAGGVVQAAGIAGLGGGSLTITLPDTPADKHTLILATWVASNAVSTTPSGWTQKHAVNASGKRNYLWTRGTGASEAKTVTVNFDGTVAYAHWVAVCLEVALDAPTITTGISSSNTLESPSVSPGAAATLLTLGAIQLLGDKSTLFTPPTGMNLEVQTYDEVDRGGGNVKAGAYAASEAVASGATGTRTASATNTWDTWRAFSVALIP